MDHGQPSLRLVYAGLCDGGRDFIERWLDRWVMTLYRLALDPRANTKPVGAGLLAKAVAQAASMSTGTAPSRASPLPLLLDANSRISVNCSSLHQSHYLSSLIQRSQRDQRLTKIRPLEHTHGHTPTAGTHGQHP